MTLIQTEPQSIKICVEKSLCFTANTAGSTVRLNKFNSPANSNFETSTDGITWSDYTVSTRITLTNIGDKVYFRNKYGTTYFSSDYNNYYYFQMTGSIAASGDVTSLLDKNFRTSTVASDLFRSLFRGCASLTTAPSLPLTTLSNNCYVGMFSNCTGLTTLPELPATTLTTNCYSSMFSGCTNIKLSTTQTGEYQTAYRIPATGTGATGTNSLNGMFSSTGGTFTGTPTVNTTYYTSNTVVPSTISPVKDVQKVYIGSTQVRPSGWQPGVNTIAYYEFEQNLNDASGNGNTATGVGIGYTLVDGQYVVTNTTSTGYINLPNGLGTNIGSGDFAISFWLYPVTPGGTSDGVLLFGVSSSTEPYYGPNIYFDYYWNKRVIFRLSKENSDRLDLLDIDDSLIGAWHHFVMTRNSGVVSCYIDTTLKGTFNSSVTVPSSTGTNVLFARGTDAQAWYNTGAKMDKVILESVGWTAQEVSNYYNQTKSNYGL